METKDKKRLAILGSTGSIGTQTLEVVREQSAFFCVEVLTAHNNADLLIQQSLEFKPNTVVIGDSSKLGMVKEALQPHNIKVFAGAEAIEQVVAMDTIDLVITALVGYSGLKPTIAAIKSGKPVCLANKETLVVAGDLITRLAEQHAVNILPVDSEHSAIFQCLQGEWHNPVEKIYLTASGGPFRGKKINDLSEVTSKQALKHPNWSMGAKITIDSATLMNKGLEMIEAMWLFRLKPEQIDVIVHPQSIIHSIVQFCDGSMKAQMGLPDMKLPIQFAMGYPRRLQSSFPRFNFIDYPQLSFEQPDRETFRCLAIAERAMRNGGNVPCVMNAANEIAVQAFLEERIKFNEIPDLIETVMEKVAMIENPGLEDYINSDREARMAASEFAPL